MNHRKLFAQASNKVRLVHTYRAGPKRTTQQDSVLLPTCAANIGALLAENSLPQVGHLQIFTGGIHLCESVLHL